MKGNTKAAGHLIAFFTVAIWATTYISTKVLLETFTPIEILFIRFAMAYLLLWIAMPKRLKLTNRKQEWYFLAAGLCGCTLYYLCENFALTFTQASNVGVIVSVAPFFTAMLSALFLHEEKPGRLFYVGFVLAMAGICLISFSSDTTLKINPIGDFLGVFAAVIWAVYSCIVKKISTFGYKTIQTTRRTFFYGVLFMIPVVFLTDFHVTAGEIFEWKNLLNLLFLGLGASAICFVTWNLAVKILGSVKTSVYIYMVPVRTTVTSVIILHETVTKASILGIGLTLAGLILSEFKQRKPQEIKVEDNQQEPELP